MSRWWPALGGACVAVAAMALIANAPAQTLERSEPIPREYFGMHLHRAHDATQWPRVAFGSWRLWDAGVTWAHLEPEPEVWRFYRLNLILDLAERAGVELVLPLAMTPRWASARPERKSFYGPGQASEPADPQLWERYVRKVVDHTAGRVRHYEIWNEPGSSRFFNGTPQALLDLQQRAYRIVKEADPGHVVISPSVTRFKDLDWFSRYLALGGGEVADVVGYHFYLDGRPPERVVDLVAAVRQRMAQAGVDKPLWNTESGFRTDAARPSDIPEDAYMLRYLVMAWAAGVDRFFYYSWDHGRMGLQEGRTGTINAAGRAYDFAATRLAGARDLRCPDRGELRVCKLTLEDGTPARLVWSADGEPRPWVAPASWVGGMVRTPSTTRTLATPAVMADALPQLVTKPQQGHRP